MGIKTLLEKQPGFPREIMGYTMASYFGGRAEVRVRKTDVPVTLVDFTSMYPTVFILQDLQALLTARTINPVKATAEVQAFLDRVTFNDLFDPKTWPKLRAIAKVEMSGDVLPVRCRFDSSTSWQIALAHVSSAVPGWYTVADLVVAKFMGGRTPHVLDAWRFEPRGTQPGLVHIKFRGEVAFNLRKQIFKAIVEQRQLAKKRASEDKEAARLSTGLKILANSASYGVFVEINVSMPESEAERAQTVYGTSTYECATARDEQPGKYFNPIIGTLVTGAARLMLGMPEIAVAEAGGTYAFCDTDSLAIVSGENCPPSIPSLSAEKVAEIIGRFDSLNPYDRSIVPSLLKREYENVRCFAVSAKRYVLFQRDGKRLDIVRPSEHGLGALIRDSDTSGDESLPVAIWRRILHIEIGVGRDRPLDGFARRQFPIHKPKVLKRFKVFNKRKPYRDQVKPWNFLQVATLAVHDGNDVLPIAPFEKSMARARKLPWVDLHTGDDVSLDWTGAGYASRRPVQTMEELARQYASHPEAKGADASGNQSGPEFRGLLGRLHLRVTSMVHVGKEIDRLDEDAGISLDEGPQVYGDGSHEAAEFEAAMALLRGRQGPWVAARLGISLRQWRRIGNGHSRPSRTTRTAIVNLARTLGQG
jgi:hypothetical protein